ncbi:MAG: LacI family DNA-binding transcriptional regulator [Clostridia bacterium]|nr:LacI family DNA-binding transcriptional regulator [Clostridia bacterium]
MNLKKLATMANVSLSTVSKAFSGSKEISESTRQKIFDIAKENGCFDKYYNYKNDKKVIAVICPEVESAYYCSMVSRLDNELNKSGAIMTLAITNFSAKKENELLDYFTCSKMVDGIIVISSSTVIKANPEIPIVAIHTKRNISEVDTLNPSFADAFYDAIKHFVDNGHEKIAFFGETHTKSHQNIFIKTIQKFNLAVNPDWIFEEKERFESAGYSAMQKIYAMENRPTAIFCAYDNIALGAIQSIRTHGQNVPEHFSIIGINDIPFASHYNISLTTIKANSSTLCDMAVDLIMKKLKNKFFTLRQRISLRSELVIRNSVRNISNDKI